jgi:hypothetical protein
MGIIFSSLEAEGMKSLDIGAYVTIEGIFKTIEITKMWKFLVF